MQQGTEFFYDNWCVISNFEVLTESEKSIFICIRKRIFPSFSSFLPNCKRMNIWWDISQIVHAGRRFPTVWMIIYHRQRWTDVQKEPGTNFEPIRALEFGISKTMSTRTEKPYWVLMTYFFYRWSSYYYSLPLVDLCMFLCASNF